MSRVLLFHDGTPHGSDLFRAALTMLDPEVSLTLATMGDGTANVHHDQEQAIHLDRPVAIARLDGNVGDALVNLAKSGAYDLIVATASEVVNVDLQGVVHKAHCPVFVASFPAIPTDAVAD